MKYGRKLPAPVKNAIRPIVGQILRPASPVHHPAAEVAAPHPLARFDYLYRPEHYPYFTHGELFRPLSLTIETINICNSACG